MKINHDLNFFISKAIWKLIYSKASAGDVGTIHAAKNFLNAANTPESPIQNSDAAFGLVESYTVALILTSFEQIKPNYRNLSNVVPAEQPAVMDDMLSKIVTDYAIPKMPDTVDPSKDFKCKICSKEYKRVKGLRTHMTKMHKEGRVNVDTAVSNNEDDAVHNYSCNALALGLLAKCFTDARKHGDGKRLLRLSKFLFLFFELAGKKKYKFYIFHSLAQVHILLPPSLAHSIVWNRTTNSKGKVDTCVVFDRTLEHRNKSLKQDYKDFLGKITTTCINRASHSYNMVDELMTMFDKQTRTHKAFGKHKDLDQKKDVLNLSMQLTAGQIFAHRPGREHQAFRGFPQNLLERIDLLQLGDWMQEKLKMLKNLSVYRAMQKSYPP